MSNRTTQRKGDIGTTQAIAYFTSKGFDVSVPITESAAYDLIIDSGGDMENNGLTKVQVKYSTGDEVDLRRIHSKIGGYKVKKYHPWDYDWLFVYKSDGSMYLMKHDLGGRRSIKLSDIYKVN